MEKIIKATYCFVFASCFIFSISCKKGNSKKENGVNISSYNAASTKELCESSWFPHAQTPPPEEGKGSPFDTISTTNAIFHQWSWQKFLWLTKPIPSEKNSKDSIPLFLNSEEVFQISSHMDTIYSLPKGEVKLNLKKQAGSGGILQTNGDYNENKKSYTVYYSIHVDTKFYNAAEKFMKLIKKGILEKNNKKVFPVGALELKVSWVDKNAIPEGKRKDYYITKAYIEKETTITEVAMLGMHVVGVVENHPEFIWATFEHDGMAPNYNWDANKASSREELLFFEKGETSGIDGITWVKVEKDRSKDSVKLKNKAFDLFQYGVPKNNGGGFMETSQKEPENFDNIKKINQCVKDNLSKENGSWKNYFYNGSIWIDTDGLTSLQQASLITGLAKSISNAYPESFARGSLNCANVTMETYTQTFQDSIQKINISNLANCFSCHNSIDRSNNNNSPLYLSHIFRDYLERKTENKAFEQVELEKSKQELLDYQRNKLK